MIKSGEYVNYIMDEKKPSYETAHRYQYDDIAIGGFVPAILPATVFLWIKSDLRNVINKLADPDLTIECMEDLEILINKINY